VRRLGTAALALLASAGPAFAQTSIVVNEVGLSGLYKTDVPTRVVLSVSHTGAAVDATVSAVAERTTEEPGAPFVRTSGRVARRIRLSPGTVRVEFPLRVPQQPSHFIRAEVAAADGRVLALSQFAVAKPIPQPLFVLICQAAATCERLQTEITFAHSPGFDETRETAPAFHRLPADRVPEQWWALLAANLVVVAADVRQLSVSASTAIEGYLRHHGRLLLIEPGGGAAWLAPYRVGQANGRPVHVGAGLMFRAMSDARGELGPIVRTGMRRDWQGHAAVAPSLQSRLRGFALPSFRAAFGYLAAYVLCVGLLNFAVLRRLRRVELGWITVPLIALAFAAGAYAFGNARRPDRDRLDEVRVLWRDDRSSIAAVDAVARIGASEGGRLALSAADLLVVQATPGRPGSVDGFFVGDGWRPDLLDLEQDNGRTVVPIDMIRWSFRDVTVAGLEDTTGTVRALDGRRLRNDSSVAFEDSCFLVGGTLSATGSLAPGGLLDLAAARKIDRGARPAGNPPPCFVGGIVQEPLPLGEIGAFIGVQAEASQRLSLNHQDVDARASVIHVIYMPLAR
jgi:hypothetical protein